MRERTRKRKREFKDVASIMEPGGEGFIYDPIFRIKLGTTPILKNFKVRSYLNFMASLPMKRNPATGYFEFAETPEEITALCKAYFYSAEPGALVDSGYDQFRINKARHLLVQPVMNVASDGSGSNVYPIVLSSGHMPVNLVGRSGGYNPLWVNAAKNPGDVSAAANMTGQVAVMVEVDAATDIIIQVQYIPGAPWFNHTTLHFTAAGTKAQNILNGPMLMRFKTTAAATITAAMVFNY